MIGETRHRLQRPVLRSSDWNGHQKPAIPVVCRPHQLIGSRKSPPCHSPSQSRGAAFGSGRSQNIFAGQVFGRQPRQSTENAGGGLAALTPPLALFHQACGRKRARDDGTDIDGATRLRSRLGTAGCRRPWPEHRGEVGHVSGNKSSGRNDSRGFPGGCCRSCRYRLRGRL